MFAGEKKQKNADLNQIDYNIKYARKPVLLLEEENKQIRGWKRIDTWYQNILGYIFLKFLGGLVISKVI